ncbi:sulfatase-like hydrolase/transferase [Planomicrobium chinense]|uniref:LTA synthase family protein n=1 Tax=Planococcus chinensis TaxID=272917 RepID=UPI001CC613E4|nr:LTA synthase family protein [Planococcus chinensis]MBZ5202064.1 sulfatase-like hydrolase/transferase [Planococcus chinensis]
MKKESVLQFFKSHLFIISLLLLLKVVLLRFLLFQEVSLLKAVVLELSYIVLFAAIIELIAVKWKPWTFLLFSLLFSTLFLAVIMYHSFFGRIVTYFALFQVGQVGTISESITALLNPVYILFFADILILLVLLAFRKYPLSTKPLNAKYLVVPILLAAIVVTLVNFTSHKDELIANNVIAAEEKGILNYEALEIVFGPDSQVNAQTNVSVENAAELQKEVLELKGLEDIPVADRKFFGDAEGRNLIVIQVESMQNFPLRLDVGGNEVTPNMNKLLDESFYFPNTAQQTGPGNTSDAEFILNTSLYPVAFNPTSQTFGNKQFPSLPRLLNERNYTTMTFHADDISFWNRDELYPALGFNNFYYGEFFGNEDVIGIGPSDEVMFDKALPVLKEQHAKDKPFFAHLIGLTSHHPFTLPAEERQFVLPDQFKDSLTGDYLVSMHYMDRVINDFIEQLKAEGIYENSVIAIYGDHFGLQQSAISERDVDLVSELLGREYQTLDRLNVPFIVHAPGITDQGETFEKMSGQLDMMPTLANLLGLPLDEQVVFGQDLLNHDSNLLGARYYLPVGSFWNDDILFMPEKGFEDGTAFDLETETPLDDFSQYKADYDRILQLESLSDAYLESLPER